MEKYPNLVAEIAKRGIKKQAIASALGISYRAFYNKISGRVPFTWPEACIIRDTFFPDMSLEFLLGDGNDKLSDIENSREKNTKKKSAPTRSEQEQICKPINHERLDWIRECQNLAGKFRVPISYALENHDMLAELYKQSGL